MHRQPDLRTRRVAVADQQAGGGGDLLHPRLGRRKAPLPPLVAQGIIGGDGDLRAPLQPGIALLGVGLAVRFRRRREGIVSMAEMGGETVSDRLFDDRPHPACSLPSARQARRSHANNAISSRVACM
jgi:hypothetical protein